MARPPRIVWQFARYSGKLGEFGGGFRSGQPHASVPARPYMLPVGDDKIARTLRSRQNYDIRTGHISYSGHEPTPAPRRRLLKRRAGF
jgi:hypothetical protein